MINTYEWVLIIHNSLYFLMGFITAKFVELVKDVEGGDKK